MLEVKRILKSKIVFIIWLAFVITFFLINFTFIFKAQNSIRSELGQVTRYNSIEDLEDIINNLETKIDEDYFYTEAERTNTIESLAMYKYLYENKIEYNQFRTNNEIGIFENDKCGYICFFVTVASFAMLPLVMFLCVDVYDRDFLNGTYKYVYTRNISREKIILKKTLINFSIVLIFLLLSFLLLKIISIKFLLNYDYIIIKGEETICYEAKMLNNAALLFLALDIIFYFIIFSSVSLFSKNYILNIIICSIILIFGSIIIYQIELKPLYFFMGNGYSLMFRKYNSNTIIWGYLVRFLMVIIIFISSLFVFKKKSL